MLKILYSDNDGLNLERIPDQEFFMKVPQIIYDSKYNIIRACRQGEDNYTNHNYENHDKQSGTYMPIEI